MLGNTARDAGPLDSQFRPRTQAEKRCRDHGINYGETKRYALYLGCFQGNPASHPGTATRPGSKAVDIFASSQ